MRPACSVLPASLLDDAARVGCSPPLCVLASIERPRPCPSPKLRPRVLYHVLVAILTGIRWPRTRPHPETSRGAPAAAAASRTLRNGRMCTTDMSLAKLHNDQETNAKEQRTKQRNKHMRSMRNNDNGLWKKLATGRNNNCRHQSCQTSTLNHTKSNYLPAKSCQTPSM